MEFTIKDVPLTDQGKFNELLKAQGMNPAEVEPVVADRLQLWLNNEVLVGYVDNIRFEEGVYRGDLHYFLEVQAAFVLSPGEASLERININYEEAQ